MKKQEVVQELVKLAKELTSDATEITALMSAYYQTASSLRFFGATDSEPDWFFQKLMKRAIKGEQFPDVQPKQWQLFDMEEGWEDAAQALTDAARKAFYALQEAPYLQVLNYAKRNGWDR